MCGSVRMSVMEKARLSQATGKPASCFEGKISSIISNITGEYFGGFLRKESMETTWKGKILSERRVPIIGFTEKGSYFACKGLLRIAMVRTGRVEARVITEPAGPSVRLVHHRQPCLL
jgi:hypothetical protein